MCFYKKYWLINKTRCNSDSINKELLQLSSFYLIVVVQSWKSTTLKMTDGINNLYKRIRNTIKLLKSKYFALQIIFTLAKVF